MNRCSVWFFLKQNTAMARAKSDPKFRQALFVEVTNKLLEGNVDTAKSILRDCINATISFDLDRSAS